MTFISNVCTFYNITKKEDCDSILDLVNKFMGAMQRCYNYQTSITLIIRNYQHKIGELFDQVVKILSVVPKRRADNYNHYYDFDQLYSLTEKINRIVELYKDCPEDLENNCLPISEAINLPEVMKERIEQYLKIYPRTVEKATDLATYLNKVKQGLTHILDKIWEHKFNNPEYQQKIIKVFKVRQDIPYTQEFDFKSFENYASILFDRFCVNLGKMDDFSKISINQRLSNTSLRFISNLLISEHIPQELKDNLLVIANPNYPADSQEGLLAIERITDVTYFISERSLKFLKILEAISLLEVILGESNNDRVIDNLQGIIYNLFKIINTQMNRVGNYSSVSEDFEANIVSEITAMQELKNKIAKDAISNPLEQAHILLLQAINNYDYKNRPITKLVAEYKKLAEHSILKQSLLQKKDVSPTHVKILLMSLLQLAMKADLDNCKAHYSSILCNIEGFSPETMQPLVEKLAMSELIVLQVLDWRLHLKYTDKEQTYVYTCT